MVSRLGVVYVMLEWQSDSYPLIFSAMLELVTVKAPANPPWILALVRAALNRAGSVTLPCAWQALHSWANPSLAVTTTIANPPWGTSNATSGASRVPWRFIGHGISRTAPDHQGRVPLSGSWQRMIGWIQPSIGRAWEGVERGHTAQLTSHTPDKPGHCVPHICATWGASCAPPMLHCHHAAKNCRPLLPPSLLVPWLIVPPCRGRTRALDSIWDTEHRARHPSAQEQAFF